MATDCVGVMEGDKVGKHQTKKRLQSFLADVQKFGSLKGFRHFAMYLRGREEMIVSVANEPLELDNSSLSSEAVCPDSQTTSSSGHLSLGSSFTSGNLPYDKWSLLLAHTRDHSDENNVIGIPPASPSDQETAIGDSNTTLFLVAGYGNYEHPYVWVRSNHDRLMRLTGDKDKDKDNPLRLKSTHLWKDSDIRIWDVLAELVKLCTYPAPLNPFAVDFNYFEHLQPKERILATSAMISILRKIIQSKHEDKVYTAKVLEELLLLTRLHFQTLEQVASSKDLLSLQQYRQTEWQKRQQHHLTGCSGLDKRNSYSSPQQRFYVTEYTR